MLKNFGSVLVKTDWNALMAIMFLLLEANKQDLYQSWSRIVLQGQPSDVARAIVADHNRVDPIGSWFVGAPPWPSGSK
jgi:hypothetical protein